jgi:hypothetical protein
MTREIVFYGIHLDKGIHQMCKIFFIFGDVVVMRVTSVHVSGIVFVLVVFISVGCYCNQFQDAVLLVQHSEKSIQSKSFPFDNPETQIRREAVKNAFIHAWEGYKRCGWGSDDVKPISCAPSNWISQDPYPLVTKRFEKGIQHCKGFSSLLSSILM